MTKCLLFQIKLNDGFPSNICAICIHKVKQTYEFQHRCKELDKFFHSTIVNEETGDKIEKEQPIVTKIEEKVSDNVDDLWNDESPDSPKVEEILEWKSENEDDKMDVEYYIEQEDDKKEDESKDDDDNLVDAVVSESDDSSDDSSDDDKSDNGKSDDDDDIKSEPGSSNSDSSSEDDSDIIIPLKIKQDILDEKGNKDPPGKLNILSIRQLKRLLKEKEKGMKRDAKGNTKVKKEPCGTCGIRFTARFEYLHKLPHSRERPYTCSTCGKGFVSFHNLVQHGSAHTGEKPHQCQICAKRFTQNFSLKEHLRMHSDDKPFVCTICGKPFQRAKYLKLHVKTMHDPGKFKFSLDIFSYNSIYVVLLYIKFSN